MGRSVLQPSARILNHTEMVYAPGDRALARELFRAIGCRVLDPQEETGPDDLGAAAGPYLIVFVEPESTDLIDNVLYASEVPPTQWALETQLRARLDSDESLRSTYDAFNASFESYPQGMTHFGVAMNERQLDAALDRIAATPAFDGRLKVTGVYRPGDPGSVDPRVIQAFLRTDIVSTSLLTAGQQIELQVRLD
ncbi:MAG: hypothetical protein ABI658_02325 [Acidimicrobiales bacterium]